MSEDKMREMTMQFQGMQQQLQAVMMQKENAKIMSLEIERTMKEVSEHKDREMYRSSGALLIKSDSKDVLEDLGDRKESANLQIKALEKQEERIREVLKGLKERISETATGAKKSK